MENKKLKAKFVYSEPLFLLDKKDKRFKRYSKFKKKHGFSPDECWNLDSTLAHFLLPRLKYFRKKTFGFPSSLKTIEKWKATLDDMIWTFEEISKGCEMSYKFKKKYKTVEEALKEYDLKFDKGFKAFTKYFFCLWW